MLTWLVYIDGIHVTIAAPLGSVMGNDSLWEKMTMAEAKWLAELLWGQAKLSCPVDCPVVTGRCGATNSGASAAVLGCLLSFLAEVKVASWTGVSENVVYPIVPNGFADHYPYEKWLFHWEY